MRELSRYASGKMNAKPSLAIRTIGETHSSRSVILPDVAICPIKQILVLVQVVFQNRLAQRFLHFAFASRSLLPVRETHHPHGFVNVRYDSLDDHWRVGSFCLLE